MKRSIRSITGAVVITTAGALALAGCQSGGGGGDGEVTIEMSWWGDDTRAALFAEIIAQFEAEHPDISVVQTPVGAPDDLFNRLATDYSAGGADAPDLFALGGAKPQEYGSSSLLLDLSTVADTVQLDAYPDSSLTSSTVDDTVYGLPTGGNAIAAYVNLDVFDQAGLDAPDSSWTWDDFVDAANTIGSADLKTETGAPIYGVDLRVQDIIATYAAQVAEPGLYDFDGDVVIEPDDIAGWYEIEEQLLEGGGLPDATVVTANWSLPVDQQPFTLGQAGMTFAYTNLAASYAADGANEIALLSPPSDEATSGVALLPSAYWAINAQSEHPDEAALLMDWFLNTEEAAELLLDTRGVQFNPEIAEFVTSKLEGAPALAAAYVSEVAESGVEAPPQPDGGANMNSYAQDSETELLFGQATPQQAAESFVEKLTADVESAK
jgi:multiple sugar transport system substrate-binding protein